MQIIIENAKTQQRNNHLPNTNGENIFRFVTAIDVKYPTVASPVCYNYGEQNK